MKKNSPIASGMGKSRVARLTSSSLSSAPTSCTVRVMKPSLSVPLYGSLIKPIDNSEQGKRKRGELDSIKAIQHRQAIIHCH